MRTPRLLALLAASVPASAPALDLDRPPVSYSTAPADNVVTRLDAELKAGTATLAHGDDHGYLKALLRAWDVPLSSQVLVFSKTSLQRSRIGPRTPRAIYFNDDVSVGFCWRGDVIEVAAADPNLGTAFYTLDQAPGGRPAFTRQTESCLVCHGSSLNQGMPGHLFRSVFPDRSGDPVLSMGTKRIDHTSPFADRWGGWYVTGTSGGQTHRGNTIYKPRDDPPAGADVTDLRPFFTVANYPAPDSDLVALLVLEHQGEAHNRITRANFLTRMALHEEAEINKILGKAGERSEGITRRIENACEPLVQYLLFADEAKLTGPVAGTSRFATEFAARGPFDSNGRSLRQFDLERRMFRYPCSYVIYSKLFDGLPAEAKERVYRRLWEVLSGRDQSKAFAHLSAADRRAVRDILIDTKPGLPAYWAK